MSRVWVALEVTKDDPNQSSPPRVEAMRDALEDELDNVQVDIEGFVFNVEVVGVGGTHAEVLESYTRRSKAKREAAKKKPSPVCMVPACGCSGEAHA